MKKSSRNPSIHIVKGGHIVVFLLPLHTQYTCKNFMGPKRDKWTNMS